MKIKKIFLRASLLTLSSLVFCQSEKKAHFYMSFGPQLFINTQSRTISAPSPIMLQAAMGLYYDINSFIAFEPDLSFFTMYNLYYKNMALPAEIENRTALTFASMLSLPVVFKFNLKHSNLQLSSGPGILIRFGILAGGLDASDTGYTGSAASDLSAINKYFWSKGRFLYINNGIYWEFNYTDKIKFGPALNIQLPLGSIFSGENIQALIIKAECKIRF